MTRFGELPWAILAAGRVSCAAQHFAWSNISFVQVTETLSHLPHATPPEAWTHIYFSNLTIPLGATHKGRCKTLIITSAQTPRKMPTSAAPVGFGEERDER